MPEHERIEPRRAQRQLHLEDDAIVAHARIAQLVRERAQRIAPRSELRCRSPEPVVIVERVTEPRRDSLLRFICDELFTWTGEELHSISRCLYDGYVERAIERIDGSLAPEAGVRDRE